MGRGFGARAAGEFEIRWWFEPDHVAERTDAAGQRGVGGDEGLGLGLGEQGAQLALGEPDLAAGEYAAQPAKAGGQDIVIGVCGFWRLGRGFGARAAGELEIRGWFETDHVAERTDAARQGGMGGDEGLGLRLIQQGAQLALGEHDLAAGKYTAQPGKAGGQDIIVRVCGFCGVLAFGFRVGGGCARRWARARRDGTALDEVTQPVVQAHEARRDQVAEQMRHAEIAGAEGKLVDDVLEHPVQALGDGGLIRHDVSYYNIR